MKILLLGGSLLANAVLALAIAFRPSLAPPTLRNYLHLEPAAATSASSTHGAAARKPTPSLWSQLATDDLKQLVQRLETAGFPANIIRSVLRSLVDARYAARIRALAEPDPNTAFWKTRPYFGWGDKRFAEWQTLQQERNRVLRDLLDDPSLADAEATAADRRRYGNLPAGKIEMIRQIEEDYAEMTSAIRAGMNGIELPEDREKFQLLANEKRKDLLGVLTPDEMADYERRTSSITNMLRSRFGTFEPSETEYAAIFSAYQALGQKYGTGYGSTGIDPSIRNAAQEMLDAQLQSSLGNDRYSQLTRAMNDDYRRLQQIAQNQSLPPGTADQAYALRDSAAQQSQSIINDTSLSPAEKRAQLKLLADNTRIQLTTLLPGDAGTNYANQASWLRYLDHGMGIAVTSTAPVIIDNDAGMVLSIGSNQIRPLPLMPRRRKSP